MAGDERFLTFIILQAMGSLVEVSMPQNGIDAEGICALAKAFSKNTNLEVRTYLLYPIVDNDTSLTLLFSALTSMTTPSLRWVQSPWPKCYPTCRN